MYSAVPQTSGIFDEKLSHGQKIKCSRSLKKVEIFKAKFNQTRLSFRYIRVPLISPISSKITSAHSVKLPNNIGDTIDVIYCVLATLDR